MYGRTAADFPRRIVCLTAETAAIARLLGAGDRVVGVPGTVRRLPEARDEAGIDWILALEPDLVLAFSERQADVVRALVGAGVAVLCTNERSLDDVLRGVLLVGGALGCEARAREIVQDMQDEIRQVREYSSLWPRRPRVYFEEWPDPLVTATGWVSDLIEVAGGVDVFADRSGAAPAQGRVVDATEVIRRDPALILASWRGTPVDRAAIARRPGWQGVAAVRAGQVHALEGEDVPVPGPGLLVGLRRIHDLIQAL